MQPHHFLSIYCVLIMALGMYGCDRTKSGHAQRAAQPLEHTSGTSNSDATRKTKKIGSVELVGKDVSDLPPLERPSPQSDQELPTPKVTIEQIPKPPFSLEEFVIDGVHIGFVGPKNLLACSADAKCLRLDLSGRNWVPLPDVPMDHVNALIAAADESTLLLGVKDNERRSVAVRYTHEGGMGSSQPARSIRDDLYEFEDRTVLIDAHQRRAIVADSAAKRFDDREESLSENEVVFADQMDRGNLIACKKTRCVAHSPKPGYCRDVRGRWFFRGNTASRTCGRYVAEPRPGGLSFRRLTDGKPIAALKMFSKSYENEPGPPVPSYCQAAVTVGACTPEFALALAGAKLRVVSVPDLKTLAQVRLPDEKLVEVEVDDGRVFVSDGSSIDKFAEADGALAWMSRDGRIWVARLESK